MTRAPSGATAAGGEKLARTRFVPFWVLQAAALLALAALADLSLHVAHGTTLVGAGVLYASLALLANGPLGVLRLCSRKVHLWLVMAASALVAVSPVFPLLRPDIEGIIIIEVVAIGMFRLATLTSTNDRGRRGSAPDRVAEATTVLRGNPTSGRQAGPAQEATPAVAAAARWAGRAAGTASQVSAQHRPAAEARLKRAIRKAGRLTGKASSRRSS